MSAHHSIGELAREDAHQTLGWPPTDTLAHHHKHNRHAITREGDGFVGHIPAHRVAPMPIALRPEGKRLRLEVAETEITLGVGEWSEWLALEGDHALEGKPDSSRSPAFLKDERGGLEIFVNRELVPAREVERVKTRILRALTTWFVETDDGERNVVAVKREDAAPLGYWGEAIGDVLFAYAQGFVRGSNARGDIVAPVMSPGANHGPQIPTARTAFASNLGAAFFHGAGVRHVDRLGVAALPRMDDVGTTLAHLLELSTASLDGKLLAVVDEKGSVIP